MTKLIENGIHVQSFICKIDESIFVC